MKKDLDKLFGQTIQTYYFLLVIVFIIKLLGGNYFDIAKDNHSLIMINDFITNFRLENIWYAFTLYLNVYITLSITCNDNSKSMKKYSIFALIIAIVLQQFKTIFNIPPLFVIIDLIYLFILSIIYIVIKNNKIQKENITNYLVYMFILNFVQLISIFTRNVNITNNNDFITYFVLNLDYLLMLIILHKTYFLKGGKSLWVEVVSFGSQKLILLKNSLKELLIESQDKKKLNKQQKIETAIYIPLYLLWNLFTMLVIIAIATLNDALSESIFITISFWINKRVFGKPFHFKSVSLCFCFSSIVYYVLTRITFHIETSLFIPIFLGVALSYVTSHFVKKNTKLYKGMSYEDLRSTIIQVTDDELTIKICKEYYCDRYNDVKIANINSYSVPSIRYKRQSINKKLKELT